MKQRIRGLVSLHEIPFPPASYKGKEAIVHIVQRKRKKREREPSTTGEWGGEMGEDGRERGRKKQNKKKTECVVVGCLFWTTWPPELHL